MWSSAFVLAAFCLTVTYAAVPTAEEMAKRDNSRVIRSRQARQETTETTTGRPDVCVTEQQYCDNGKVSFCIEGEVTEEACPLNWACNCEKTDCVSKAPTCPGPAGKCKTPGTKLPNNRDCTKYTYCDDDNELNQMQCVKGLYFDLNSETCLARTTCRIITCPSTGVTRIGFPQNKQFYVQCSNGKESVQKCSITGYGIETGSSSCQFVCQKVGQFKDQDPTACEAGQYYICNQSGSGYSKEVKKCSKEGYKFDDEKQVCSKAAKCTEATSTTPVPDTTVP